VPLGTPGLAVGCGLKMSRPTWVAAGPPKKVAPMTSTATIGIIATSSQRRQTGERTSPAVRSWPQKPQKRSKGPATP